MRLAFCIPLFLLTNAIEGCRTTTSTAQTKDIVTTASEGENPAQQGGETPPDSVDGGAAINVGAGSVISVRGQQATVIATVNRHGYSEPAGREKNLLLIQLPVFSVEVGDQVKLIDAAHSGGIEIGKVFLVDKHALLTALVEINHPNAIVHYFEEIIDFSGATWQVSNGHLAENIKSCNRQLFIGFSKDSLWSGSCMLPIQDRVIQVSDALGQVRELSGTDGYNFVTFNIPASKFKPGMPIFTKAKNPYTGAEETYMVGHLAYYLGGSSFFARFFGVRQSLCRWENFQCHWNFKPTN